jgi:uridylate kinase
MLPEQRATSYAHDAAHGTVMVVAGGGAAPGLSGDVPARLLLDAARHLVGIDVSPDTPERVVVMLGPHEAVAQTEDGRVLVQGGGRTFTLQGTSAKLVAPGASPYVP